MVKNFVFIEDGSLNEGNLDKLRKVGITDENMVVYRQGSTKPELVSVEHETPQLTNELMLKYLEEFLYEYTEKKGEEYYDNQMCRFATYYTLTAKGNVNDFMNNFKEYLSSKDDKQ